MMSARCVTEVGTEQTLSRPKALCSSGLDEGGFAQSLSQGMEESARLTERQPSQKGLSAENLTSQATNISKGITILSPGCLPVTPCKAREDSPEIQMTPASSYDRADTKIDDQDGLAQQVKVGNADIASASAGGNEQDAIHATAKIGVPRNTSSQMEIAIETITHGEGISGAKNQFYAAGITNTKSKQGMSLSTDKQKFASGLSNSRLNLSYSAAVLSSIQDRLQCPGSVNDSSKMQPKGELDAVIPPTNNLTVNSLDPAKSTRSQTSFKEPSVGATAANTQSLGDSLKEQIVEAPGHVETGKRAVTSVCDSAAAELKVSGSGVIYSNGETNLTVETSTIVSAAVPSLAISGEHVDQRQHAAESTMHALPLSHGLEESRTFDMDSSSIDGLPKMLLATHTALEVGVQSETHGWLKVRAELTDSGAVNASLSTTSSASQTTLHRELPELTAYLQEEKLSVNSIVVHSTTTAGPEMRDPSGAVSDRYGGQMPQGDGQRQQREQDGGRTDLRQMAGTAIDESWIDAGPEGLLATVLHSKGRNWLSVRA